MILIVMGVSGSGKTTIGYLLARSLEFEFKEGDDFHSAENVGKMQSGTPLNDNDRMPWIIRISAQIKEWIREDRNFVLTCSALKKKYREVLTSEIKDVRFIYLRGNLSLILDRLKRRSNHFMPLTLLESQFAILEEPEVAIVVDIANSPSSIVAIILMEIPH